MNHRRRRMMLAAAIVMLAGCSDDSSPPAGTIYAATAPNGVSNRFAVQDAGCFKANPVDRSINRCMYLITDTVTGVQYLAVAGCGTSQIVTETHGAGKNRHHEEVEER